MKIIITQTIPGGSESSTPSTLTEFFRLHIGNFQSSNAAKRAITGALEKTGVTDVQSGGQIYTLRRADAVEKTQPRLKLSARETATILAGLRRWQQHCEPVKFGPLALVLNDIATDCGKLQPLSCDEIDALCKRINLSKP